MNTMYRFHLLDFTLFISLMLMILGRSNLRNSRKVNKNCESILDQLSSTLRNACIYFCYFVKNMAHGIYKLFISDTVYKNMIDVGIDLYCLTINSTKGC